MIIIPILIVGALVFIALVLLGAAVGAVKTVNDLPITVESKKKP